MQKGLFSDSNCSGEIVNLPDGQYRYFSNFIEEEITNNWFNILLDPKNINWQQEQMKMFGKTLKFPRLTAWYGDKDKVYSYAGLTFHPNDWTPTLLEIKKIIEDAFENRDQINAQTKGEIRDSVDETLSQLDTGFIRVCEKNENDWIVNQWIKKAILLSFRLNDNEIIKASHATWFDKVESKTANWTKDDHLKAGFRYVPDAVGGSCFAT